MENTIERYGRQMLLKGFGEEGQQKLLHAKVLVVGAGGLGCPVLQYLAAAGIGCIGIVDDDVVSLSNLHRQVLYGMPDIGLQKATCAAATLQQLNPDIQIKPYNYRLTNRNALDLIAAYDIVVDGTDNFSSRYLINDACMLIGKPVVYGAVSCFEGQITVLNGVDGKGNKTASYRDLFPLQPQAGEVLNCAEAGVLGVLPGVIGTMQAAEVIKLITGIGEPLCNRLLTYNILTNQLFEISIYPSEAASPLAPKDNAAFLNMEYDQACTVKDPLEINAEEFDALLHNSDVAIIDVREENELPIITDLPHRHIPLMQLQQAIPAIVENTIITFCQSGKRSRQAAALLVNAFGATKKVYSLKEGIAAWQKEQQHV